MKLVDVGKYRCRTSTFYGHTTRYHSDTSSDANRFIKLTESYQPEH